MALVVQNDSGTAAGANAYVDVAYLVDYCTARGYATVVALPPERLSAAIIIATEYLDGRWNFVGRKLAGFEQPTQWPRANAFDADRQLASGIPKAIRDATCEYARRAAVGQLNPDPTRDATGYAVASISKTVGPIQKSITYAAGGRVTAPVYPEADNRLRRSGLVQTGGTLSRA